MIPICALSLHASKIRWILVLQDMRMPVGGYSSWVESIVHFMVHMIMAFCTILGWQTEQRTGVVRAKFRKPQPRVDLSGLQRTCCPEPSFPNAASTGRNHSTVWTKDSGLYDTIPASQTPLSETVADWTHFPRSKEQLASESRAKDAALRELRACIFQQFPFIHVICDMHLSAGAKLLASASRYGAGSRQH